MYEKQTGRFIYRPGAVMCNMLLADEINRASSKTQAKPASRKVMEEGKVTVDNETHPVPRPFVALLQRALPALPEPRCCRNPS
ncbi:MAG: AAA family ATPase [Blautia faecis]